VGFARRARVGVGSYTTRLGQLLGASAPASEMFGAAHPTVLVGGAILYVPALTLYLTAHASHLGSYTASVLLVPAIGLALLLAAAVFRGLPPPVRAVLASVSVAFIPPLANTHPFMSSLSTFLFVLVLLGVRCYRHWGLWALTAAVELTLRLGGAFGDPHLVAGQYSPAVADLYSPAAAATGAWAVGVFSSYVLDRTFAFIRRQSTYALGVLDSTRRLLGENPPGDEQVPFLSTAAAHLLDAVTDDAFPYGNMFTIHQDTATEEVLWSTGGEHYPDSRLAALPQPVQVSQSPLTEALMRHQGPVWVSTHAATPGVPTLPEAVRPVMAAELDRLRLRTVLACPVLVDDRAVALVELYSPQRFHAEPPTLQKLYLLCLILGRVVERNAAKAELRTRTDLLSGVAEAAPDTIIVYDQDTDEVLLYGPAGDDPTDPADAVGASVEEVFAASVLSSAVESAAVLRQRLREQQGRLTVTGRPHPGRSRPTILELALTEMTIGGRRLGIVFARDVTSRETAARELAATTARAAAMEDMVVAGLLEADSTGAITYANSAAGDLLGAVGGEALVGHQLADHLPFLTTQVKQALEGLNTAKGPRAVHARGRIISPQGSIPVDALVTTHVSASGEASLIVTLVDVSTAESAAKMALRQSHARELNDNVVQGLVTALYGLEVGEQETAEEALRTTLKNAKGTIATLLGDTDLAPHLLQRRKAAQLEPEDGSPTRGTAREGRGDDDSRTAR
jgi:PAS domain-containing protein